MSKVTDTLINLKNSNNLSPNNLRNSADLVLHGCTDSLVLLSHINNSLGHTHKDNILFGQSVPCLRVECAL